MKLQFEHVIPLGDVGSVDIKEADGVLSIAASIQKGVGGGLTQVSVQNMTTISVPAKNFEEAAIKYLESKVQGSQLAVGALEALRKELDADL